MGTHEKWMQKALGEARRAFTEEEVPVGAVVVYKGRLIARAHNQVKRLKDPTAHAEMIAITQASSYLKNERLNGAAVYVTIEPCSMCVGALILARVKRLVFGAPDEKTGACGSILDIPGTDALNHHLMVIGGVLKEESAALLRKFFKERRGA